MKIILWKKITLLFKNRRMGDFVCNFTAVVLGIILTFMGSDWIEKRNMPAAKIGRLWKFKVSEVDAWMKSGVAADK